jgi:hypothetical protein
MNQWYMYTPGKGSDAKLALLEEVDGIVYERWVELKSGQSFNNKSLQFHLAHTSERIKQMCEENKTIRKVTEAEVFAIML